MEWLVWINAANRSEEAMRYLQNGRNRINISMIQSSRHNSAATVLLPVDAAGKLQNVIMDRIWLIAKCERMGGVEIFPNLLRSSDAPPQN